MYWPILQAAGLVFVNTAGWVLQKGALFLSNWPILQAAGSVNGDLDTGAADEATAILNAINSRFFEAAQNLKCNLLFESEDFL